ncbi:MAG: hypothetical protein DMF95_04295 [Acidobacteria bacterium]|nr:MAG: hypothetical protein DMF95_04295 [Acidobacteriota bacterium]
MWEIDTFDVISLRRGAGDRLTAFVDDLIRAECLFTPIPLAAILTNLRTNLGDKGVDTRVADGVDSEPTGWLQEPTIWQYKAASYADVTERIRQEEIEKEYAAECIRQGHAYRFVIADDMPPATKKQWQGDFEQWARAIAAGARTPAVLTAGDLAAWANRYPALVARHFAHRIAPNAMHAESWGASIRNLTPDYVRVPDWDNVEIALGAHVDFRRNPADPVFVMQGEAGVGKTRLAYETLVRVPHGTLLVYTLDPSAAVELAYQLANDAALRAILVSDECDVDARYRLNTILQGHRHRVRVVAIDNTGIRTPQSAAPEYWLRNVPENIVESVLARNYPAVPHDRRRAYASLAGGFITLAADLCRNDATLAASGGVQNLPASIYEYYRRRLPDLDRSAIETLSLVRTIGYSEDRADELNVLCRLTGQDPQVIRERLLRLHDVPGFVGRGGRLLYVTPQAIAQVAFENAWTRWAAHNPPDFLSRIPGELLDNFLERVKSTAGKEVRDTVAAYFRAWLVALTPDVLTDAEGVDRIIALAEANPEQILPLIKQFVGKATADQLRASSGEYGGGWGPRRKIVWLCENLAHFSEFFFDCEAILLRLALHETEKNIANNATGVWAHLHKIVLSGTPVRFLDRLALLKDRLRSNEVAIVELALKAIDAALDPHAFGLVPDPVIAGRLTPPSWRPGTRAEALECERAAFALLASVIESDSNARDQAVGVALDHLFTLVTDGLIDECRRALRPEHLSPERRAELINTIERILARDKQVADIDRLKKAVAGELIEWMAQLRPHRLHERFVAALAVDPWRKQRDEIDEDWRAELVALAETLVNDFDVAKGELAWLMSRAARSSVYFGEQVGRLDAKARVLDLIIGASADAQDLGFVRGYVSGLLELHQEAFRGRVNAWLDSLEDTNPQAVYEVSVTAPDEIHGFERVIRLVAEGKVSGAYLRIFGTRIGARRPSEAELRRMLCVLIERARARDNQATDAALDIAGAWLHRDPKGLTTTLAETLELLWIVAEFGAKDAGQQAYEWLNLLMALTATDPIRAAKTAIEALLSDRISLHVEADQVIAEAAKREPEAVMEIVGRAALDPEKGWRLGIGKHGFHGMPSAVLLDWVHRNGLEAARVLARHLPAPYLQDGEPVVAEITARILDEFGDDEDVFSEFCVGLHDLEVHVGKISHQYESQAALANHFLGHPIQAIRRWAQHDRDSGLRHAELWRRREEEQRIRRS